LISFALQWIWRDVLLRSTAFAALFLLSILCRFEPSFAADDTYLASLLEKAHREKVHEERTWEVLLHYTRTRSGGYQSRIDDPKFFLSTRGRTDPEGELAATLKSFFVADAKDGTHAACRFPYRFQWLSERLGIDPARLPAFTCSERDKSISAIEAKSAVLVFPVGHINSPASMFGHTLIRIDGSSRSSLISYAVNYAASGTDSNGFLYAWKGLTGGYKGYFSIMPYYEKVKEYNDLEHRDMWEYRLKLSEEEVRRIVTHCWELHQISSSYYFLDENCSYNLLFLIEAARPTLRLTEQTGLFVLPTQTIRIARAGGILEEPLYRPSRGTRIRKMMSQLEEPGQLRAYQLAHDLAPPQPATEPKLAAMQELDLAVELAQYRFDRKELAKEPYNKLYLKLLRARSTLGAAPEGMYEVAQPPRPEAGHDTATLSPGGGVRRGEPFVQIGFRPVFHTLNDPDQGYLPGAQIKFFDTALRYDVNSRDFQLKTLHLLDIFSLAPRDALFKPLSWKVNTGLDTEPLRNGQDYLLYRLNSGGGFAYNSPLGGLCYLLGELDFNAGEKIRAGATVGPGLSLGDLEQLTDWWKLHLSARAFWCRLGDDRLSAAVTLSQNFRLSRNNSLSVQYGNEFVNSHRIEEAGLFWNRYF
jgi:hypothetical protein